MNVSVPIWGLFNLTYICYQNLITNNLNLVSVPIWGLFNLTTEKVKNAMYEQQELVSVPIWGLFNLTERGITMYCMLKSQIGFRPHLGII